MLYLIALVFLVTFPCRQVRDAERFNWAATRGVNEEMLLENLPEDLQREIRRHLFKFIKKVSFFIKKIIRAIIAIGVIFVLSPNYRSEFSNCWMSLL